MPLHVRAWLMRCLPIAIRASAIVVVLAVALGLRLYAAGTLPIDFDEDDYLRAGQQYAAGIRSGDWGVLTRENYRTEHPPLAKIAYGAALLTVPQAPLVADEPSDADPATSLPQPQLKVARSTAAVFGSVEAVVLALVSPLAGLFLAVHTWDIKYTSQVMLEALPALLSLVVVACWARSRRRLDRWAILSAVALGLTAASKYLYCTAGIAVALAWLMETRPDRLLDLQAVRRWLAPVAGYVMVAMAVFVAADPYLWPDPAGRLWSSIAFHAGYATGAHVADAGYPPWQPFVWLIASVPWSQSSFLIAADIVATILALYGMRRLWQRQRVYVVWFAVSLVFLLAWPTKWPQYILILTAPLSLAAAEGFAAKVAEPLAARWRRSWQTLRARRAARAPVPDAGTRPAGSGSAPVPVHAASRRRALRDARSAAPWLLPGAVTLVFLAVGPLVYQLAMAITDFTSRSIKDGITGGVVREAVRGVTGQVAAVSYVPFSGSSSTTVHYAGPGMLINAVNSIDGASLLAFDLLWTGLSVAAQVALGVGVALLLERRGVRFKGWWRALFIAPWAIPEFVGAVAWRNLADPQHGWIALTTGASIDWTTNAVGTLIVALVVATWCGWPLVFLAATAGLNAIPPEVQEAAAIDGAGMWHRFRHVTWPLLAPLLAPAILVRVIFAFNQFYVFYVLASSSQNGLPISTLALTSFYVFDPTSGAGEFALSAVINILAVVVLIALVLRLHGWQRQGEAAYA